MMIVVPRKAHREVTEDQIIVTRIIGLEVSITARQFHVRETADDVDSRVFDHDRENIRRDEELIIDDEKQNDSSPNNLHEMATDTSKRRIEKDFF